LEVHPNAHHSLGFKEFQEKTMMKTMMNKGGKYMFGGDGYIRMARRMVRNVK
jgi:hypothetical protein